MVNELLLFFAFVSLTFGTPTISPVNNAFASLQIADLFRITQSGNNFTIIDYLSQRKKNVCMDYKNKIVSFNV
uniref:Uncharacterized protein n=1 Tax=Panagrolaimus superbus TaxID=310955 RepID=A0A914Y1W8_9BILA